MYIKEQVQHVQNYEVRIKVSGLFRADTVKWFAPRMHL